MKDNISIFFPCLLLFCLFVCLGKLLSLSCMCYCPRLQDHTADTTATHDPKPYVLLSETVTYSPVHQSVWVPACAHTGRPSYSWRHTAPYHIEKEGHLEHPPRMLHPHMVLPWL